MKTLWAFSIVFCNYKWLESEEPVRTELRSTCTDYIMILMLPPHIPNKWMLLAATSQSQHKTCCVAISSKPSVIPLNTSLPTICILSKNSPKNRPLVNLAFCTIVLIQLNSNSIRMLENKGCTVYQNIPYFQFQFGQLGKFWWHHRKTCCDSWMDALHSNAVGIMKPHFPGARLML